MNTVERLVGRNPAAELGLGVVFLAGNAFTAYRIGDSWGAAYAVFDLVVGVVVCALALSRARYPVGSAAGALAVAAVALVVSRLAGLPREPGPVTALALSVLVGSVIRRQAVRPAVWVAAGGLAVAAGASRGAGHGIVAVAVAAGWIGAVVAGTALRRQDRGGAAGASGRPR